MTTPNSAIASSARRWTCPSNRRRGIARAGVASSIRCALPANDCAEVASTKRCALTTNDPLAIVPPRRKSPNAFADRLMLSVAPGCRLACPFCSCWRTFHSGGWKASLAFISSSGYEETVSSRRQLGKTSHLELTGEGATKEALGRGDDH